MLEWQPGSASDPSQTLSCALSHNLPSPQMKRTSAPRPPYMSKKALKEIVPLPLAQSPVVSIAHLPEEPYFLFSGGDGLRGGGNGRQGAQRARWDVGPLVDWHLDFYAGVSPSFVAPMDILCFVLFLICSFFHIFFAVVPFFVCSRQRIGVPLSTDCHFPESVASLACDDRSSTAQAMASDFEKKRDTVDGMLTIHSYFDSQN